MSSEQENISFRSPKKTPRERFADACLYLVSDARATETELSQVLNSSLSGGVEIIQLRDKNLSDAQIIESSKIFRAAADRFGALFILNDRPDLVGVCAADGVHIGQDDGPSATAREVIGPDLILGRSTHAPEQAISADNDPNIDYLSIGPVFLTPTKPGRPATGIQYVQFAVANVKKPWFAIGDINPETIESVVEAGARRVVVVRALTEASNPEAVARKMSKVLNRERDSGTLHS